MKKALLLIVAVATFTTTSVFAQKLGHVDAQGLMLEMQEYKDAEAAVKAKSEEYEKEIQRMLSVLEKDTKELQAIFETLSPEIQQIRMQELQEKEMKIQQFQMTAQENVQKLQGEKLNPLVEKVRASIQKVGKDNGYTYIYDSGVLLYVGDSAEDLAPLVKKDLGIE